ncbi:MAG TPA: glycosyltransferase family 4 protein [Gaiellaceae bacterium]
MRALWFGTYDRAHPRNAQAISALRGAGVEVTERNARVRQGRGPLAALRIVVAETKLMLPRRRAFDVVVVGYPGHFDVPQARSLAGGKPLVFLPRVSLVRELVERRGRFRRRSITARVLEAVDARALKLADLVVADSDAAADVLARVGDLPRERVATVFTGAEERVFDEEWTPVYPFGVLHVAGAGTSLPTLFAAAEVLPELPFRVVGAKHSEGPANVESAETGYDDLGLAYAHAGIAVAGLDAAPEIPDAAFQALATGTPLVTADTPAARELLVDGETALLVQPGDPRALADALRRLAADRELLMRLSANGRRLYTERASEAVLGVQWRALLERYTGIV